MIGSCAVVENMQSTDQSGPIGSISQRSPNVVTLVRTEAFRQVIEAIWPLTSCIALIGAIRSFVTSEIVSNFHFTTYLKVIIVSDSTVKTGLLHMQVQPCGSYSGQPGGQFNT